MKKNFAQNIYLDEKKVIFTISISDDDTGMKIEYLHLCGGRFSERSLDISP